MKNKQLFCLQKKKNNKMPASILLAALVLRKKQMREERIRKRFLRDLSNPMDTPDLVFVSIYRLNKNAFQMILNKIVPHFERSSIPLQIQAAAALRFLVVGSFQGVIANDINICMGRSTFCKSLWKVLSVLEEIICPAWIKIEMSQENINASKAHFYEYYGIPCVVGCVDGTLIKIVKPPSDASIYYCRKGYFSINAMIVCDYEMNILAVDGCRPGSCHDSFVWGLSDAKKYYSQTYRNGTGNCWLLGDSGYVLTPYLIIPYKSPEPNTIQHKFNQCHSSARNIVERTIGVVKGRFRCLQNTLHYTPLKVVMIINVCCALHNICRYYHIELDEEVPVINNEEIELIDDDFEDEETYGNEALRIRDDIASSLI